VDLAHDLGGLDEAEAAGVWSLLSVFCIDSPFLVFGLGIAVVSYLLQQRILAKTNRLELMANNASVDFIVAVLANRKKTPRIIYKPEMWMNDRASVDLPASSL
jgi:hypothetical protein